MFVYARGARASDVSPLDLERLVPRTPWWPCRPPHSGVETFAVHGFPGYWLRDGRPYRDRPGWGRNS